MKIRSGFVSNSSSSSFIFALPKKPESVSELQTMLFGTDEGLGNPYTWDDKDIKIFPAEQVAEIVFRDIQDKHPSDPHLIEEAMRGWDDGESFDTYERMRDLPQEEQNRLWDQQARISKEKTDQARRKFMAETRGSAVYAIEISDGDGSIHSAMEHGDLFERVPHIQISHH
jgi:hypothetical protein